MIHRFTSALCLGAVICGLILTCSAHAAATAPVFTAGPTASPNVAPINTQVNFSVTVTGTAPITIGWDFGDGSSIPQNGANINVAHSFTQIASRVVTATAIDGNGLSTQMTVLVTVTSVPVNLSFQMHTYTTTIFPLGNGVPASGGRDLVFVILPNNQKYLCIPTDPNVRATFDPNNQRFYRVDSSVGLINGFNALNSTLINLDGTFFGARTDTPPVNSNGQSSLESYSIPLTIDSTKKADISILDPNTMAYRTSETNIYEIERAPTSIVFKTTPIPLIATGALAIDYDIEDQTHLLVESPVTDPAKAPLPVRISSYFRSGQFFDQLILDNNPLLPNYSGNASSITWDVDNGDIYVLDGSQLIAMKLQRATITSVTPNHGPVAGGTAVTINGTNFPTDAIVFFDGVQVKSEVNKSSTQITCTTPAHVGATVDVTMTGTGIIVGSPAKLPSGYTYGNAPPIAVLSVQSNIGSSPFTTSFNIAGTSDKEGTIASVKIDFGDGTSATFPNDLSVTTMTHVYSGNSIFTATLTITDTLGPSASASVKITVGKGGSDFVGSLLLKTLSMNIGTPSMGKDKLSISGQIVLPVDVTPAALEGGYVKIVVNSITVNSANVALGKNGKLSSTSEKFSIKLLKGRGVASGTYLFTYSIHNADLSSIKPALAMGATRTTIPVNITMTSNLGRNFYYGDGTSDTLGNGNPKIAVVDVKDTAKSSSLSLVRK